MEHANNFTIDFDQIKKIITIHLIDNPKKVGRPRKTPEIQVKHRGPSKYNLFISNALKEIANEFPHLPSTERMQIAQEMYRNSK